MGEQPDDVRRRPLPADMDRLLHDLRGPLNSATMHAEVLRRSRPDDPQAGQSLRTLVDQLGRMAELLHAAFEVLALERGDMRRVSLGDVVAAAVAEPELSATVVAPGAWPDVVVDERLARLAVSHLVRNAVEATEGPRPPEVGPAILGDGRVALQVRSWGPGLPGANPKALIRLLHSRKPGHRGLGLPIADRVARLHGGALAFESTGNGTLVTLILPSP
jgi:signal transduction histidine kinase